MATPAKQSPLKSSDYVYTHITKVPGVCGGRPCIDGTRVRVLNIVYLLKEGYKPRRMLEQYPSLNLAQVHAALAYYYDHQEEIESYIEEDEGWDEKYERERVEYLSTGPSSTTR